MESKKTKPKVEEKKSRIPPRYDKAVREEVVSLAKEGYKLSEILDKVQPKKRAVLRYLKKAGIEIKRS